MPVNAGVTFIAQSCDDEAAGFSGWFGLRWRYAWPGNLSCMSILPSPSG